MATMAFPPYDGYDPLNRMSRRQSLYGGQSMGYPYDEEPDMYRDPMMPLGGEYPQPSYQIYAPTPNTLPMNRRLTGPSFEDLALRDGFHHDRQMSMSMGPMTPMMSRPRHRRHSTVSFMTRQPSISLNAFRPPSSLRIKFKKKGSFMAGLNLGDAQSHHVRLSNNDSYSLHDLHADRRNTIFLRIRWTGYSSLTYEIPLDTYDGRISLATLARRVSRACVHYLQANIIPVPWDRVELHHLEEVAYGVWQPMLSTR